MDYNNFIDNNKNVFTVTEITVCIKEILESSFGVIKIEGEISNWRPSAAGHVYFTLKDNHSQIKAVMFRGYASYLKFTPKDGDKVCCTGKISLYEPQGTYQIIVTSLEKGGEGNILQMLEERKRKFAEEGLFDEDRKKPLPFMPRSIGVVTSPTGAAIKDIINVTTRRNSKVSIKILPAIVQGDEAAATIVKQINTANRYSLCDVLIVGRGGGSLEDLLPFSEECVIRAIASSDIPVISAVGHEIDWALSDYVADKRAPTPSAAAEIAVPLLADIEQDIDFYKNDLYKSMKDKIEQKKLLIKSFNPENLEVRFRNIQQPLLNRYAYAKENLYVYMHQKIEDYRKDINNMVEVLNSASPNAIFDKGYSMVTNDKGIVIRKSEDVKKDDVLKITVAKGCINAKVI